MIRQKKRYDIKHQGPALKIGDKVLRYKLNRRRNTRMGDKLGPRYTGPYEIIEVIGHGVFRLKDGETILKQCVNGTNLKPYFAQSPNKSPNHSITHSPIKSHNHTSAKSPTKSPNRTPLTPSKSPKSPAASLWNPSLGLSIRDKSILECTDWLEDTHINAINTLVAERTKASIQATGVSKTPSGFSAISGEVIQILHDTNHWVTCGLLHGDVFLVDSLNNKPSEVVTKQMKQLFARQIDPNGKLRIRLVPGDLQNNAYDCGVYAAAYAFDLCDSRSFKVLHRRYQQDMMRDDLINCLDSRSITPFPAVSKRGRHSREIHMYL